MALGYGQSVEVLDAAPGGLWKVRTIDEHTRRESVGVVPKSCLGLDRPVRNRAQSERFEAETGQEVLKMKPADEVDHPPAPLPNLTPPSSPLVEVGGASVSLTASEENLAEQLCSEETTGQSLVGGITADKSEKESGVMVDDGGLENDGLATPEQLLKRVEPVSDLTSCDASGNLDDTITEDDQDPTSVSMDTLTNTTRKSKKLAHFATSSLDDVRQRQKRLSSDDFTHTQSTSSSGVDLSEAELPTSDSQPLHHPANFSEEASALSLSIRSLPATFSPAHKPGPAQQAFLGYDPMQIPTSAMSQPSLAPPEADRKRSTEIKAKARRELEQLQLATVKVRGGGGRVYASSAFEVLVV